MRCLNCRKEPADRYLLIAADYTETMWLCKSCKEKKKSGNFVGEQVSGLVIIKIGFIIIKIL